MKKNLILTSIMVGMVHSWAFGGEFTLSSPSIKKGASLSMEQVFNSFGCTGKNISPQLEWTDPPAGTQSFAITMYDPDAPTGSGWWHWVVFNIPSNIRKLEAGAGQLNSKHMPKGAIQSRTDFGKPGYGGPCPPPGPEHHYYFRVYALKDKLNLKADTPAAQVGYYIGQNKLAEAELMGIFKR
jgi:Raf kinase inhibitor-like YbhB/YbcL family protein